MDSSTTSIERTFLLTDVVGSTALHRRYPGHMLGAMDLHDHLLQAAIRRHGGDPFKNTGDGVYASFDHPLRAVLAIEEATRGLRAAAWGPTGRLLIRAGIHTGLARPRGSDWFGPALHTVTRLGSAAHADQVLVSAPSVALLATEVQAGRMAFVDLGDHHFKGIDPLRVLQLDMPGLPRVFPPIGGKRETADGNLPATLNAFFGREEEIEDLVAMTHASRVLTLIGPGGIGKTRLAVEFARSLKASFPDGAWFVDLSALERGADVWPVVAASLLIEPQPGMHPRTQVLEQLHGARAILLMDNCEHVLDPIAEAVLDLAHLCPTLFIINTSRRTLGVDGEALFEVAALGQHERQHGQRTGQRNNPRLDKPHDGSGAPAESTAARLFVARARLVDHRFQASAEDLATIERICAHLEHMPLAIEIAAGHLRRLSVKEIAAGVTNPLDLGASRLQRRAGRQQTLRQTLEWSYGLLDPASRRILARLAVFSGPFHEEQALALCLGPAPGDVDAEQAVLDGIDELVESSLLARDAGAGRRFRMLQTVQAFGREKLARAGELQAVEHRHGQVFAARCRELAVQITSDHEAHAIQAVFDELANLRSAFERALTQDLHLAADIAASLFLFNYAQRGVETTTWPRRVIEQARPPLPVLPQLPLLLAAAAVNAFHADGDTQAAERFIALGLQAEAEGQTASAGWLQGVAGQIGQWSQDTAKCLLHLRQAAECARAAGNLPCEVTSLCMAVYVAARSGDHAGASALVQEVSLLGQRITQPTLLGYVHYARGRALSFKDPLQAIAEYQISVEWALMGGNLLGAQRVKHFIAELQAAAAPPAEALAIHLRALAEIPTHGATFYAWATLKAALLPLSQLGADSAVVTLAGALRESPVSPGRQGRQLVEAARARLSEASFALAQARGACFDLPTARAFFAEVAGELLQPPLINAPPLPEETSG